MQSLSKTQWFGLSFLVLHTIIVAMVYAATRTTHSWEITLVQEFFDYPLLTFIEDLSRRTLKLVPDISRYATEIEFGIAAILGGTAYYMLGLSIGFVMTLVEPKTKEHLDSQDTLS